MALALPIRGDAGEGEWKNVLKALVPGDYVLVRFPNNKYGAIVEKVKKGSAADCEGRLLPGKLIDQT